MKFNYLIISIRFEDVKTKVLFSFKPIVIYFDIKKSSFCNISYKRISRHIFYIIKIVINQIFKRKKYLKCHKNMA